MENDDNFDEYTKMLVNNSITGTTSKQSSSSLPIIPATPAYSSKYHLSSPRHHR